mmetsp:Transcript_1584/g.5176  ORF Transcript_1584/g.5176 Transcript_1584/m.5176 type:complete len:202 (-) Transcript_1584:2034-2639(-)
MCSCRFRILRLCSLRSERACCSRERSDKTWRRCALSIAAISVSASSAVPPCAPAFSFSSTPQAYRLAAGAAEAAGRSAALAADDETTSGSPAKSARDLMTMPLGMPSAPPSAAAPPTSARDDIVSAVCAAAVALAEAAADARLSSSACASADVRMRSASNLAAAIMEAASELARALFCPASTVSATRRARSASASARRASA